MSSSSRSLLFALALTLYVVEMASAETLCGGELVDALQFVCEDRGFYFSRFQTSKPALTPNFSVCRVLVVVHLRTSVWIAGTISHVCGCVVCLFGIFLSHALAFVRTRSRAHATERKKVKEREIVASCLSQDLVQAALLSVRILPTVRTSHCI